MTLLSKIRRPELAQPRRAVSDREIRESILQNLINMCCTRLGTMLTCPDYGIADVSEMIHSFPDAISLMAQTLRHTIQTYEPRLQNIQVIHVPSEITDLTLRFEVRGRVVLEGSKTAVKFETALDPSRKLTIR
ncbi:MAG: type VI secretion system baseplate subunit TssE [Polyangiaceae bacterium]